MEQPLVSVITVTYNSAAFVRDTIESVLAQTYSNLEYIIADDSSRDETWKIIQEYRDPRIRAWRNESNLGEYANRNKAIDQAAGEYLLFIDGDDIIFPHGVSFFVEMIRQFPGAGMAIQKGYINNVLFPALMYPNEVLSNHYLGKVDLLSSSFASNFFSTAVLRDVGKLSTRLASGDNDVRARIASLYPVLFVAGWVSWPRETPGQAASRITTESLLTEMAAYTTGIFRNKQVKGLDAMLVRDIESTVKKKIARYALRTLLNGKLNKANQLLVQVKMNWKDVTRFYNFQPTSVDLLESFSPVNPFKRGFLHPENPLSK